MDGERYAQQQAYKETEHELLCRRCGVCCGVREDACVHLGRLADGTYYCDTYGTRLGKQRTVSGKEFTCVPIRDVLMFDPPHPNCPYAGSAH